MKATHSIGLNNRTTKKYQVFIEQKKQIMSKDCFHEKLETTYSANKYSELGPFGHKKNFFMTAEFIRKKQKGPFAEMKVSEKKSPKCRKTQRSHILFEFPVKT